MTAPSSDPDLSPGYTAGEAGYVNGLGPSTWQAWAATERVPDLQWPASVETYRRMVREDSRVSSVLSAIKLPILRTPWRIEPAGAPDEVVEFVSQNFGLPIVGADEEQAERRRLGRRLVWSEYLRLALEKLRYGFAVFEQVYQLDPQGMRVELWKLAPRPQSTICDWKVALDGGLEAVVQRIPYQRFDDKRVWNTSTITAGGVVIPIDRLVVHAHDMDPGVWVGNSILRPSYKHWLLKDELMRIEAATARRNGMGVPVATAPPGASQTTVDAYRDMATEYRGGEHSGVGLPEGANFQLLGVQGNLPDLRAAIEYHDRQIAVSGLAHFLNIDRGGSYALASVQADTFVQSVQSLGESIRDTTQAHVLEDLVDLNFGEDVPAPRLIFDEIGSRQDLTAAALRQLIDAGLIRLDRDLEEYTRQQYGLPPKGTPAPGQPGFVTQQEGTQDESTDDPAPVE